MIRTAGAHRAGTGWQLILADLALILFLLALSALPAGEAETGRRALQPEIAPAQALYRLVPEGPSLGEWLAAQAPDPRATLTIFAVHAEGSEAAAWARAQGLASEARARGARVRTIITIGPADDVYASLAYDELIAETPGRNRAS